MDLSNIFKQDQNKASMTEFVALVAGVYRDYLAQGLSQPEAMTLTVAYQNAVIHEVFQNPQHKEGP